ncbi:hypothetical protein RI054_08g41100 [Pseudoscourfieldia marina]
MMAAPTAQAHEATETTATRITEEAKDALRAYFSTLDVVRTSKLPRKGASEVLDNIIISHASLTREKAGWQLRKYKIEQNIITPVDVTATQDEIRDWVDARRTYCFFDVWEKAVYLFYDGPVAELSPCVDADAIADLLSTPHASSLEEFCTQCRRDAWWCHSVPAHHHVSVKFCTVVGLLLAVVVGDANGIGVSFTDARDSSMVPLHAGVGAEPLLHTCARGYVFVNVRKTPVRKTPRTRNTPRTRHGNQRSKESRSKESECPAVPGGVKAGQG